MAVTAVYYAGRFWGHQQQEAALERARVQQEAAQARARAQQEAEKERIVSFSDFMGMGKQILPVVILEKRDRYLKIRTPNGQIFEYSGDYTILQ